MPKFLNQLDIFALTPTRRESFGIAVAEASACGKPVVTTNISGLVEVVENEVTGLIVDHGDCDQISAALLKLAGDENLRHLLGNNGRTRIKKYFTEEKMIAEFAAVFTK